MAVLLYARGPKGEIKEEITGKTRLMKLMFLLIKEENFEYYLKNGDTFKPYKYGPYDSEIYDALEALESLKIIDIMNDKIESANNEIYDKKIKFRLTEKGLERTKKIVNNMPINLYKKIEKIKRIYSRMSLIQLLYYVYNKYPEYAGKSELDLL